MKSEIVFTIVLICAFLVISVSTAFAADTLIASDFNAESWAKTIDFFSYARAYAPNYGMTGPPADYHALAYITYVNVSGMQMLYAGLINVTFDEQSSFTIPMQTFMMHYKTENHSRDAVVASSFLMLLAFNETDQTIYPDSPDMNDTLWSSFSMGFDFEGSFPNAPLPSLKSETSIIPLSHSDDKRQWFWGMKYTNLTAVWWRTWISPTNHTYNSLPVALVTYDELTFNYTLAISPETNRATLTENHVIGRIQDLWHFGGWLPPTYDHYNSTGCYRYGNRISDETVYEFIQRNQIKMSIVDFQTSVMFAHETYSLSANGQNVTDSDDVVSHSAVSTYADDGEKIFDASFGSKETYRLYNYTADQTESAFDIYDATARTSKIAGFAENRNLFAIHNELMEFLPLLVAHIQLQMYPRAKEIISNMSRANYFYLIAYPNYSGYKIEHDPVFTAYTSFTAVPEYPPILIFPIFIVLITLTLTFVWKKTVRRKRALQGLSRT